MMSPQHSDGAGLRPVFPRLLDKRDVGANGQTQQSLVEHARVMEVDPAAIGSFYETVIVAE